MSDPTLAERLVTAAADAIDKNADRFQGRDDWVGEAGVAVAAVLRTLVEHADEVEMAPSWDLYIRDLATEVESREDKTDE